MKKLLFPLLLAGVVALIFSGCKKEESDTETQSAVDNSICEGEFMRIMPTVNSIAITESGVKRLGAPSTGNSTLAACPVITVDSANIFPGAKLIIDYGTGCVDSTDGKTRRGKIIARFSESWDSVGCEITITLDDFYVNNIHYEGTVKLTRNSLYAFTTDVIGGKCTTTNWVIEWASSRTVTQTQGMSTLNPSDDVFSITGNANGVNRDGVAYTVNVTSPLIKAQNCAHISAGVLELTPQDKATRTVDFGDGTCDNKATLTINGNTFTFTMN